jgi:hypothetical protein
MERRTSQRIINTAILQAAGVEENRLILSGGRLLQRSHSGELIFFGNISTRRLHWRHGRFYHKTGDEHYIFDARTHNGSQEQTEEEDPGPEPKAIKLYYYSGQLFCPTKNGVLAEDNIILQEIRE